MDLLTYPPLRRRHPFEAPTMGQSHPVVPRLIQIYERCGFGRMAEGRAIIAAALRGSTAAYCQGDQLCFRHRRSDIDIVAISNASGLQRSRYRFFDILSGPDAEREMDILCLTPANLYTETSSFRHVFLISKLVQPSIPFIAIDQYMHFRIRAASALILRGLARRARQCLTPSGAARLIIEEDIFAEPWRWQSLHTYYVASPSASDQRQRLGDLCLAALRRLQDRGLVTDISARYANPIEPIFAVDAGAIHKIGSSGFRPAAIFSFVIDQFGALFRSGRRGFSPAQATRLLMKAASLRANPLLRYDADIVFQRAH